MRHNHLLGRLALLLMIVGGFVFAAASPARAAPPSNDDFDNAVVISALPFSDMRDTQEATYADDDPQCTPLFRTEEATVWYAYRPASDQQVLISTAGSSYNPTLAVFTGSRGSLSRVASVCGQSPGELRFDAVAATTYYIQVGVFTSPPISALALALAVVPPPSNDDISAAAAITSLPYTDRQDVRAATASAGDPFCSGQGRTVWYAITPAQSGRLAISTLGSSYNTILGVFIGDPSALTEVTCNDDAFQLQSRAVFDAVAGTHYFIVVGAVDANQSGLLNLFVDRAGGNDAVTSATPVGNLPFVDLRDVADISAAADDPACFDSLPTAWYRYTPLTAVRLNVRADAGAVGVYTGDPHALNQLACGKSDPFMTFQASVSTNAAAGTIYYIGVGAPANIAVSSVVTYISAGPANDDFDAATVVPVLPYSDDLDIGTATVAFGEGADPGCRGGDAFFWRANVWYAYQATASGLLEFIARGGDFQPQVGAYSGQRGNLVELACSVNQSDPAGLGGARVVFSVVAGQTYYIAAGTGFDFYGPNTRMTVTFDVAPPTPANDDFTNATVVSDPPFSDTQDALLATTAPDDPACYSRTNTYWYTYTPQVNERVAAAVLSGSSSVLGVYTGTRGDLQEVSCTDTPFNVEFVFLDLTGGTTYYFMVAGAADNGIIDQVTFTLDRVPPPPPPLQVSVKIAPQANMLVRSGAARLTVTITCSREAWISIAGDLSQSIRSRTISGPIGGWVYCTDTVSTPLIVSPMSGRFLPLRATAAVSITAYDPLLGEIVSASDNQVLRLRPAVR